MFDSNIRLFLYVTIAVMTAVISETSLSMLPTAIAIGLKATLQGLIAWRAYIDETPATARKRKEEIEKLSAQSHLE